MTNDLIVSPLSYAGTTIRELYTEKKPFFLDSSEEGNFQEEEHVFVALLFQDEKYKDEVANIFLPLAVSKPALNLNLSISLGDLENECQSICLEVKRGNKWFKEESIELPIEIVEFAKNFSKKISENKLYSPGGQPYNVGCLRLHFPTQAKWYDFQSLVLDLLAIRLPKASAASKSPTRILEDFSLKLTVNSISSKYYFAGLHIRIDEQTTYFINKSR